MTRATVVSHRTWIYSTEVAHLQRHVRASRTTKIRGQKVIERRRRIRTHRRHEVEAPLRSRWLRVRWHVIIGGSRSAHRRHSWRPETCLLLFGWLWRAIQVALTSALGIWNVKGGQVIEGVSWRGQRWAFKKKINYLLLNSLFYSRNLFKFIGH